MNDLTSGTTKEHKLIKAIKEWTGERIIGDDCAILPGRMLVTMDTLVEKTHFLLPEMPFEDLGWKAVAVNVSDIAAMAGRPRFIVVSLTLPSYVSDTDIEKLFRSMIDCARTYRSRIVGGDITKGDNLSLSLTVIGDEHECGVFKRSGASAGDVVIVTGDFGASAAGLWLLKQGVEGYKHCREKHNRPVPRLKESWALMEVTGGTGAMMDASDGLADAVLQIAEQSAVGIELDLEQIPVHEETLKVANLAQIEVTDWSLYGGEDYELVACVRQEHFADLQRLHPGMFHAVGTVVANPDRIAAVTRTGSRVELSFDHTYKHFD